MESLIDNIYELNLKYFNFYTNWSEILPNDATAWTQV